ncbi:MAG: MBL fold metallo-hydrolase [Ruminococcaceae bacterium]|nr:MBL fold metallo-hydrolase [Oscillospiraceae bacterium]
MRMPQITDVRAVKGDSAFLIDDGECAILYDTGFAFTGERVAQNVKKVLGDRPLDYIFLTHSHYDHAAGTPYVKRAFPNATVVAGAYAARIFEKPSAKALMRELDAKAAAKSGVFVYEDLIDRLFVERTVEDGDVIDVGKMRFEVLSLPGHTKCSVGYYCRELGLLLSSETLGVFNGKDDVVPSYLVGYEMSLFSIARIEALAPERILLPHLGLIEGETVRFYIKRAKERAVEVAETVKKMLLEGRKTEEIVSWFETTFWRGYVREIYPIDAMRLNTGITVRLLARELLGRE